jgi:hypothetical protein
MPLVSAWRKGIGSPEPNQTDQAGRGRMATLRSHGFSATLSSLALAVASSVPIAVLGDN